MVLGAMFRNNVSVIIYIPMKLIFRVVQYIIYSDFGSSEIICYLYKLDILNSRLTET